MKRMIRVVTVMLLAGLIITSISPQECFARRRQKYQKELSDNPQLDAADKIYKKAVRFIVRGDGAFRKRPGEAVQLYSNAESYLNNTIFKLQEIGNNEDIDVSKEVKFCERLRRETHVKKGKAKKEAKH